MHCAEFIRINTKLVQASQPCRMSLAEMVGREREMGKILAAWMGGGKVMPLAPLLVGPPGLGKNRMVYEMARRCGKQLYIVQGTEEVTAEELACSVRFSDDPDKKMDYIASPLVTAMIRGDGGICFVDEIAQMRPKALASLASLLDERRYIDSSSLGERVMAHPGFRFIAATNTTDMERTPLPDFMRSRLRPVITVGYPDRQSINRILETRFPILGEDQKDHLDCFWANWRSRSGDKPPSPRDSIYIFAIALNLADRSPRNGDGIIDLEYRPPQTELKACHIEEAFNIFAEGMEGVD